MKLTKSDRSLIRNFAIASALMIFICALPKCASKYSPKGPIYYQKDSLTNKN